MRQAKVLAGQVVRLSRAGGHNAKREAVRREKREIGRERY